MKIIIPVLLQFFIADCNYSNQRAIYPGNRDEQVHYSAADSSKLDHESVISELKASLNDEFVIEKYSYFVIASNLSEEDTKKIIDNTVGKSVDCFYNNYFETRPTEVTTILLFRDDKTYRSWARTLYGDEDISRFGYYKPGRRVMLMNISTGTGTLVHEITHSLVRFDFPGIPSWFNEGLGSLYERCSLHDNEIIGHVNWRLPALQEAIANKTCPSIEKLTALTDEEFYGSGSGLNYAQARYLCMYLQQLGLLKKFYRTFRDGFPADPTGKSFLESILNKKISLIDSDFIGWVKTLKYE